MLDDPNVALCEALKARGIEAKPEDLAAAIDTAGLVLVDAGHLRAMGQDFERRIVANSTGKD